MFAPILLAFALIGPPISDVDIIDAKTAHTIAHNHSNKEQVASVLEQVELYSKIQGYVYKSIRRNAEDGKFGVQIAHPDMPKLHVIGKSTLKHELEELGYKVEYGLYNTNLLRIDWTEYGE